MHKNQLILDAEIMLRYILEQTGKTLSNEQQEIWNKLSNNTKQK
jgi:vacuolar-type H+-ATPase subunit H